MRYLEKNDEVQKDSFGFMAMFVEQSPKDSL